MPQNPQAAAENYPISPTELLSVLDLTMTYHTTEGYRDRQRLPLCIWGQPGVGKTEIVQTYARSRNIPLVVIHPAQFEEMGDLLGMPFREGHQTHWAPPAWVPTVAGPGILLLDDLNRADARILNGLLALLQDGRLASWELPDQWVIVATANPQMMHMSVTHMDEAITGRMQHVHLQFDRQSWFSWARDQHFDITGLSFLARYPELLGTEVSPREAAQFLQVFQLIPKDQKAQIQLIANSMLPPPYADRFNTWINLDQFAWLNVAEFLEVDDAASRLSQLDQQLDREQRLRLKLEFLQELIDYLAKHPRLQPKAIQNLVTLLSDPQIDGNMVLVFLHYQDASSPLHQAVIEHPLLRSKIL
ncbi:MAG: AAA family ATPase [Saprospiraceae bacterium]|nr:AAA family ATPase [Saprospiraceae bacterium]